MKRVLLDTGMLVGLMREAPWALKADAELDLSGPETLAFTSAVCRGELMALAEKRGWGAGKRERMESRSISDDRNQSTVDSVGLRPDRCLDARRFRSGADERATATTCPTHVQERSLGGGNGSRGPGSPRVHGHGFRPSRRGVVEVRFRRPNSASLISEELLPAG